MKRTAILFTCVGFLLVVPAVLLAWWPTDPYPPVPQHVDPIKVSSGDCEFELIAWCENDKPEYPHFYVFFHIKLLSQKAYLCGDDHFTAVQNGKQIEMSIQQQDPLGTISFCDDLYVDSTFILHDFDQANDLDESQPFKLVFDYYGNIYTMDIVPRNAFNIIPANGIWKSEDNALSMYLQKYQTGSCAVVITMGDGVYTAFLDDAYSDGVACSNDLDLHGHTFSLTLTDATHGALTVTLPGWGQVVTQVECKFPDTQ